MSDYDLVGLSVVLVVILAALYGLYRITKPVSYTKEAYERRLKKSSGIARGTMNAMMYPIEKVIHPKAVEALQVQRDIRAGYYDVQQESGDGFDEPDLEKAQTVQEQGSDATYRRNRVSLLRRFFNVFRLRP